ncbi:MAG: single-strand binding protein/Primosomal replication protein n, partial [Flavipsychrobacter sp.]|nr:single-strand binding protein/Primosomal replication protein n [Flavipsychrobacter sp.]
PLLERIGGLFVLFYQFPIFKTRLSNCMEIKGSLAGNAVVRIVKEEKQVVSFTVVVNDRYKPKNGDAQNVATFINCSYWISTKVADALKKGSIVTVAGRIAINSYKTNDGEFHANLVFHVNYLKIIATAKKETAAEAVTAAGESKDDLPF